MIRSIIIAFVVAASAGLSIPATAQTPDAEDVELALSLLSDIDVEVPPQAIHKVVRKGGITVVRFDEHHRGLRVFDRQARYLFRSDGSLAAIAPRNLRPMRRPVSNEPEFPDDTEPQIGSEEAIEYCWWRVRRHNPCAPPEPEIPVEARLGFYQPGPGLGRGASRAVLSWKVFADQTGVGYVDAISGSILDCDPGWQSGHADSKSVEEPEYQPPPDFGPDNVVGGWKGESCETRHYVRKLYLLENHTFTAMDLVAPCPVYATCFWSGNVRSYGTWRIDDSDRIALTTLRRAPYGDLGVPVPETLTIDVDNGVLRESGEAGESCIYRLETARPELHLTRRRDP